MLLNKKQIKNLKLNGRNISKAYLNNKLVFSIGDKPQPDPPSENDYRYIIDNNEVTILGYFGDGINPTIPSSINNIPVTKLEVTSFSYSNIQSVIIPEGITEIL